MRIILNDSIHKIDTNFIFFLGSKLDTMLTKLINKPDQSPNTLNLNTLFIFKHFKLLINIIDDLLDLRSLTYRLDDIIDNNYL